MATKVIIPVTDHNDGETCSLYYTVRFKPASLDSWFTMEQVQPELTGSPAYYGIVLQNLDDNVIYNYEITRSCCEGTISAAATGTFNTTL